MHFMTPWMAYKCAHDVVTTYWDVHILNVLEAQERTGLVCIPALVRHEVDTTRSDRGSSRIMGMYGGLDLVEAEIVYLNFASFNVGFWNRIRTLAWALWFCHGHGCALVVNWKMTPSCDAKFEDVMKIDAKTLREQTNVQYVKIISTTDSYQSNMQQ